MSLVHVPLHAGRLRAGEGAHGREARSPGCVLPAEQRHDDDAHHCLQRHDAVKETTMRTLAMTELALLALLAAPLAAHAQTPPAAAPAARTPSPPGAEVYIISPKNGAKVKSPALVQFGLKGMGVAPAGVKFENSGHHHLLIDPDARQAHAAAPARRSEPYPARPAGDLEKDHDHGGAVSH